VDSTSPCARRRSSLAIRRAHDDVGGLDEGSLGATTVDLRAAAPLYLPKDTVFTLTGALHLQTTCPENIDPR